MHYGFTFGRVVALASILSLATFASASPVQMPASLEKMTDMADLIVKAKVISTDPAEDAWFEPLAGFTIGATKLEVISVFKGEPGGKIITFRHYLGGPSDYMPQHYKFMKGRSYIVFAGKTDAPAAFRQLSMNQNFRNDQGVLLAADDQPRAKMSVENAYWSELTGLLVSPNEEDVVYAVRQLNEMSGGDRMELKDFGRAEVAGAIRPLLSSNNEKIAAAAIGAAGSRNPYMAPEHAIFWLATIGKGHLPGLVKWDPKLENRAGRLLSEDLANVANSAATAKIRALAIRALGRTDAAELHQFLDRWAADKEPLVRQAAVVLFADVPGELAGKRMQAAAGDPAPEVRQGAAQAIGFAQRASLVPLLGNLLKDDAPQVRDAAAMSLVSFSVADAGEVIRANHKHAEYRAVFVNMLAADDPAPYLDDLQEIAAKGLEPPRFWSGLTPASDASNILFKYVQSRPPENLKSGK